jgi:hypothetical protein
MPACVVRLVGVERRMVSSQSHLHGWYSSDRVGLLRYAVELDHVELLEWLMKT